LEEGKLANHLLTELSDSDLKLVKSYCFLTLKPFVYAINIGQDDIPNAEKIRKEFQQKIDASVVIVCAKLESEMMGMSKEEKLDFVSEMLEIDNVSEIPTLDGVISLAFDTVGLMYYFTT
jgi:ribosome-binding ATPase YchF (GTP1/OBG family)